MTEKSSNGVKFLGAIVLGFLLPTMYILGSDSSGNAKASEYDHEAIVTIERNLADGGGLYTQNEADHDWTNHDLKYEKLVAAIGELSGKMDLLIKLEKND